MIKYFYLFERLLQLQEMIEDFQKTLGESALSNATVFNWIAEFESAHCTSGRPNEATTPEMSILAKRRLC